MSGSKTVSFAARQHGSVSTAQSWPTTQNQFGGLLFRTPRPWYKIVKYLQDVLRGQAGLESQQGTSNGFQGFAKSQRKTGFNLLTYLAYRLIGDHKKTLTTPLQELALTSRMMSKSQKT